MSENFDSQEIWDALQEKQDEVIGSLYFGYIRGIDFNGDYDEHCFTVRPSDIVGSGFITGFSDFIQSFEPENVEVYTSGTYPLLKFKFDKNRVTNTPPKSDSDFRTVEPSYRDGCFRCGMNTEDSIPKLKLKQTQGDFEKDKSVFVDLCVHCSPGHYTDISRALECIYVEEETIKAVDVGEQIIKPDDSNYRNVMTKEFEKVIKRDILPIKEWE